MMELLLGLLACQEEHPSLCDAADGGGAGENILLILTDDIGLDKTAAYDLHPTPPPTPNLDALAAEGVRFRNAYATPSCSPSRAALLTGRHGSRTGLGVWLYAPGNSFHLAASEVTIPEMLRQSPYDYRSAAVGKWHLIGFDTADPARSPLDEGFDCHAGTISNPLEAISEGHYPRGYTEWEKSVDGVPRWETTYMVTDTTDEALRRVERLREPWFIYVAYNGAHTPLHRPPEDLYQTDLGPAPTAADLHDAMVEAVDTEIGRLIDGIPDDIRARTTILYLSDNGTPSWAITPPWDLDRGKLSIYEGGVRIPLIVTGPHVAVAGSESTALVHVVDLLPTIAAIAEVDLTALEVPEGDAAGQPVVLDGASLLPYLEDPDAPGRDLLFSEGFEPNGLDVPRTLRQRMVRDRDWKLMETFDDGVLLEELFRLDPDQVDEGVEVRRDGTSPEEAAALARLQAEMKRILADLSP